LPLLLSEPLQPGQLLIVTVGRELVAIPRSPEPQLVRQAEEPATAQHQADQRPIVKESEELELQLVRAVGGGQERREGRAGWPRSRGQVNGSRSRSRLTPAGSSACSGWLRPSAGLAGVVHAALLAGKRQRRSSGTGRVRERARRGGGEGRERK